MSQERKKSSHKVQTGNRVPVALLLHKHGFLKQRRKKSLFTDIVCKRCSLAGVLETTFGNVTSRHFCADCLTEDFCL